MANFREAGVQRESLAKPKCRRLVGVSTLSAVVSRHPPPAERSLPSLYFSTEGNHEMHENHEKGKGEAIVSREESYGLKPRRKS